MGMAVKKLLAVGVLALALAAPASAANEQIAAAVRALSGKTGALTACIRDDASWSLLTTNYSVVSTTLGFVLFDRDIAFLSPFVCTWADAFIANPSVACEGKELRDYFVTVKKRVRVRGKWRIKKVRVHRTRWVPIEVACPNTQEMVLALHVITHEAMHVYGVNSRTYGAVFEQAADCYALQRVSSAAQFFGASAAQAQKVAIYDLIYYDQSGPYKSPDCRDGGPWDLNPGSTVFP
jgi:hypothetical protein